MINVGSNKEVASEDEGFRSLMVQVKEGSDTAVWQIIKRYEPHIRRVIRRRLSARLQSKFDTMDFVQMVWKSFFHRPIELSGFSSPQQFVAFLAKMALHKVDTENRKRLDTQKYDIQREEPLHDQHGPSLDSPSQIVMARDHWDQVLRTLPPHHREVVRLRLEGLTHLQIADRLQLNERTTRRIIKDLLSAIFESEK